MPAARCVVERFLEGFVESDGCWQWSKCKNQKGYGLLREGRKSHSAHRFSWEYFNEMNIPEDMIICHTCDNPSCVNPQHLFLGTHYDNVQDKIKKGRIGVHSNSVKTHCVKGHAYSGDNLYVNPTTGSRFCRQCKKDRRKNLLPGQVP